MEVLDVPGARPRAAYSSRRLESWLGQYGNYRRDGIHQLYGSGCHLSEASLAVISGRRLVDPGAEYRIVSKL